MPLGTVCHLMQGYNLRLERIRNHLITKLLQTSNISKLGVHFNLAYAGLIWKQLPGSSISIAIALKAVAFPAQGPDEKNCIFSFRYWKKITSMMFQDCLILEQSNWEGVCTSGANAVAKFTFNCILQNLHVIEFCTIWDAMFERQKHELYLFWTKTRYMGVASWSPNSTVIHLDI